MPGGDRNIGPNDGKKFSKDYQPDKRRKALFQDFKDECRRMGIERATNANILECYEYMMGMPYEQLEDIARNHQDYPAIIVVTAKSLIDPKKQDQIAEKMLDRAYGKSPQTIKVEGATQTAIPDETAAQLAAILKSIKGENEAE